MATTFQYRRIEFSDVRMADGGVHRQYSDGRHEWRWRDGPVLVRWRANDGSTGVDERLARRYVKRTVDGGGTRWGRDVGYGRTVWSDGTMTQNRTSFDGRLGALLAVASLITLAPAVAPPVPPTADLEAALRREQAQRAARDGSSGSGSGGSGGGGSGSGDPGGSEGPEEPGRLQDEYPSGDDAWDDGGLDSDDFG